MDGCPAAGILVTESGNSGLPVIDLGRSTHTRTDNQRYDMYR